MIYLASLTAETQDKINGYTMVRTKEELNKVVADNTVSSTLIIRRDFAQEYFTPTGLAVFIENAKTINRNLVIELDIKSNILTHEVFINKLYDAHTMEDLLILLTAYPKEFVDTIQSLTGSTISNQHEMLTASNNVSRLQSTIDILRSENEQLQHALSIEQGNKLQLQSRLDVLIKRINYQYNVSVDERKLFQVDTNMYDKVLYIKEITRVQYIDSLIYYLKEIFRVLYNMPTRLVVIESYYGTGKLQLYPDLKPHHELTEHDVIAGDILMLGLQPQLMMDILKNPSHISLLIVLDRGGYRAPHIKGNNVEYLYTASDLKDIPEGVPMSRVISYDESTLFIPYLEGFSELDEQGKITKYSSTTIVKKITSLIEGR